MFGPLPASAIRPCATGLPPCAPDDADGQIAELQLDAAGRCRLRTHRAEEVQRDDPSVTPMSRSGPLDSARLRRPNPVDGTDGANASVLASAVRARSRPPAGP